MTPPLKPGVPLAQPDGPVIETERLLLRQWRGDDVAPNTAMLADPGTARFITVDGKPVTSELNGWRNAAIMAGHWVLQGVGMFVVEEKSSGKFVGRVGPWFPPGWPGFEVGWGIAPGFRGKGYVLAASLFRGFGTVVAGRLAAAFALGSAAHAVSYSIGAASPVSAWHAPLIALSTGNVVVFWLFTRALFDDAFKLRAWHALAWVAVAVV